MLKQGDKIGLVCCSDGLAHEENVKIEKLEKILNTLGIVTVKSPFLYRKNSIFSGTGMERAAALMEFYKDASIRSIFDISGGNAANGILEYLDYKVIKKSGKTFFGYSDLTTVINAIYTMTGEKSGLYQIRNLIGQDREYQVRAFQKTFLSETVPAEKCDEGTKGLCHFEYSFLKGNCMRGITAGGNLRCLLKLAGTPFWPDLQGKILFLESNGGEVGQIDTMLNQLRQMGVFKQICGVLLGTFTAMEKGKILPTVEEMVLAVTEAGTPVAKTGEIGHASSSKCLMIGQMLCL